MNHTTDYSAIESAPAANPAHACPPAPPQSQIVNRKSRRPRIPRSLPLQMPDDPETDTLRMQYEGQPGNWLRIGHGCFMKKAHGR